MPRPLTVKVYASAAQFKMNLPPINKIKLFNNNSLEGSDEILRPITVNRGSLSKSAAGKVKSVHGVVVLGKEVLYSNEGLVKSGHGEMNGNTDSVNNEKNANNDDNTNDRNINNNNNNNCESSNDDDSDGNRNVEDYGEEVVDDDMEDNEDFW